METCNFPGDGKGISDPGSHPEMLYLAKSLFAEDKTFHCEAWTRVVKVYSIRGTKKPKIRICLELF